MKSDLEVIRECMCKTPAADLDYEEWLGVGMALKDAGGSVVEYDLWSGLDHARYNPQEILKKWMSFKGKNIGKPVGAGTVVKVCQDHGGSFDSDYNSGEAGHALDWDSVIGGAISNGKASSQCKVVDQNWIENQQLPDEQQDWNGVNDFSQYIKALFNSDERINFVIESFEHTSADGKKSYNPKNKGASYTQGELLEKCEKFDDLGAVVGDWEKEAGAWIRFNPMDGNGVSDTNVTSYRHALVECDNMDIERQYAIYLKCELPIAALVHSGGKSLHAVVKIEADSYQDYQKRVDFLYDVCRKNGLTIDRKNRNPSRLSRLPGATRNGNKQRLIATNIGKPTWLEWTEWLASVNDDLPEFENMETLWNNMPPLAEPLIDGILRKGHKMLLTGPSKAGKSYLLQQMAVAIAEGRRWMGWQCVQGRVLYVNLELDKASCPHRIKSIYETAEIRPTFLRNLEIWNLRGKAVPMDVLTPKLIRRALKQRFSAIIIDPIYKVITGDENAADQMAKFCNQFDRICTELGTATIYCHHHSKGEQGQKKAHDRGSGSGVFARDPDALLDIVELHISEATRKTMINRWQCDEIAKYLSTINPQWCQSVSQDDAENADKFVIAAQQFASLEDLANLRQITGIKAEQATAWRMEGILREFAGFKPRRFFFRHPIHINDETGILTDSVAMGELDMSGKQKKDPSERKEQNKPQHSDEEILEAIETIRDEDGLARVGDLKDFLGVSEPTARKYIVSSGKFYDDGLIVSKKPKKG